MTRRALHHKNPLGEAALLVDKNQLQEIVFCSFDDPDPVGNVYAGRVIAVNETAGGAFIDLGLKTAGYLPLKRAPKGLHQGQTIGVEIDRASMGDKGPRLKLSKLDFSPSAEAPALLQFAPSVVLHALKNWQVDIVSDCGELRRERLDVEIISGADFIFDAADLEEILDSISSRQISLPSGGNIVIEQTAALVAIDVNSGDHQGSSNASGALAVNLEAIECLARQLVWRDLSGVIVIDFLRLKGKRDRQKLMQAIHDKLDDACQTGGFTATGLFDLTRQRQGNFAGRGFQAYLSVGRILAALRRAARQSHKRPLHLTLSRRLRILWAQVDAEIGDDLALELGAVELHTNHKYRVSEFEIETP
jgi:hypothetical protein